MKNIKREGFTLVELLIVIVVIGVLSAMMMLSSTEAVSSAKAADIVSDLRNLKTAALSWYADNLDYVEGRVGSDGKANPTGNNKFSALNSSRANIIKYMNNDNVDSKYTFGGNATSGTWFVWCNVTETKVFEKLKSRKDSVGLYLADSGANATKSKDIGTATSGIIGMFIR